MTFTLRLMSFALRLTIRNFEKGKWFIKNQYFFLDASKDVVKFQFLYYIDLNDILHSNFCWVNRVDFCCVHIFLIKICRWNKCLGVHINSQENYVFHLGASSKKICCHNTYHERYNRNIVTLIQCVEKINEFYQLIC